MSKLYPEYSVLISTPDMLTPSEDLLTTTGPIWHGSAIMWHSSIDSSISCIKTNNHRITAVRAKLGDKKFLILSVYFPTSGKDDEYLECSTDIASLVSDNKAEDENILIGSDTNCSEKSSSRRILSLQNLCAELDLARVSTNHPTFHHHNGVSASNIDCFLISKSISSQLSDPRYFCVLDTPENLSSHDPVSVSLCIPTHPPSTEDINFTHTYTDIHQQRITWDADTMDKYQHTAAKALLQYEKMFPLPEHIPLKCELYSSILVRAAELCCKAKSEKRNVVKKNKPSHALHQAWLKLQKHFKKWKMGGKIKTKHCEEFIQYKRYKGEFQLQYRKEKEYQNIRFNNTIMNADYRNKNEFFNIIKNVRRCKKTQLPGTLNTPAGNYHGENILEGFAADAELLAHAVAEAPEFDNDFYKLCILDNSYIFEFKGDDAVKIPEMTMEDLKEILCKEMKLKKACDIYKLTVEHLRFAGTDAHSVILRLLNNIINNIYFLTCPQIKKGLSSAVYKGKRKPVSESTSYRRITVTPYIGSILDRYIDPMAEHMFLKVQSSDQLGFTRKISYLMAAVERGECQRYALDTKQTCFGVSFDGQAAFPSVDRDILVRELYSSGETGDLLQYSNNTYQNTVAHMKQKGKLSRQFSEFKGQRQGHKRAAGNFKSYINPCLMTTNLSQLGFWIGPICVTCICVADDTYVLSNDPRKLQAIINIVRHYGRRYRLTFGADKTKITITGSKQDMAYYKDINLWSLGDTSLPVTENNEHLGLVVSGLDEEMKNVDENVNSARKILFNLLGNIFAFKCKISPQVLLHVWTLYVSPVLRSGLAVLLIRPGIMKTLSSYQNKILRGILKLSAHSPVAPLYFLLGELPIEAVLHMDILTLFWCIWSNPQTKIHEIVKYLLMMADSKSLTWSAHLRLVFQLYKLPDPLMLLNSQVWPKDRWRVTVKTMIASHHEAIWRSKAATNSKLAYFNVQASGLSGRPHPVLTGVMTTQEVMRSRVHIKMLAGDYPCQQYVGKDRDQDTSCRLCLAVFPGCPPKSEDMEHLLTRCRATAEIRQRIIPDILTALSQHFPGNSLLEHISHGHLTQFLLDPTSLSLPQSIRISPVHPALPLVLNLCRHFCFAVHKERTRQLKLRQK